MKKWTAKFMESAVKTAKTSNWDEIDFQNGDYHYKIILNSEITSDYKLKIDNNNGIIWAIHNDEIATGVINYVKVGIIKNGIPYKF